jgi:hypothetical protein
MARWIGVEHTRVVARKTTNMSEAWWLAIEENFFLFWRSARRPRHVFWTRSCLPIPGSSARIWQFDKLALLILLGRGCGSSFQDCSLERANIKPKIQRRHLFAYLTTKNQHVVFTESHPSEVHTNFCRTTEGHLLVCGHWLVNAFYDFWYPSMTTTGRLSRNICSVWLVDWQEFLRKFGFLKRPKVAPLRSIPGDAKRMSICELANILL